MSYNLQQLLEETPSKGYADSQATTSSLAQLWKVTMKFIEDNMLKLKAVNIADLGLFTFVQEKLDFGREHHKAYVTPAFLISSTFCRSYNVKTLQKKPSLAPNVPVVQLNHSQISTESGLSRDQVTTSLKALFRCLGEHVRSGEKANIDFTFAKFMISTDQHNMRFSSDFANQIQKQQDIAKPKHLRASSASSQSDPATSASKQAKMPTPKSRGSTATPPSRAATSKPGLQNILSLDYDPARPAAPTEKYRSRKQSLEPESTGITMVIETSNDTVKAAKPVSTPNGTKNKQPNVKQPPHVHTSDKEKLCELCLTRKQQSKAKEDLAKQEKQREQDLAAQVLSQSKQAQKEEELRQLEERRKRKECDEFNKSQKPSASVVTSIPGAEKVKDDGIDSYGYVFDSESRKSNSRDGSTKKKEYNSILQAQIDEKNRLKEREKEVNRQIEMELLKASQEEHLKEQERRNLEKKQKQAQMKEYFDDTINGKGGLPVAEIGSSEIQFLSNRAVATPDLKKKQKNEAKLRMEQQMEMISSKQKDKHNLKKSEEEEAQADKKRIDEEMKKQKEQEAAKKAKAQAEMAEALQSQIEAKQKKKQQEHEDQKSAAPYLPIGENYIEEHDEHCKDCGRVIQTTKTFHKAPNKSTKDTNSKTL